MTPLTVKAEFVLDVDCPKAANLYFARVTELLMERPDMRSPLLAACGTVTSSVSMPLVTEQDLDRRWDDLLERARTINAHATRLEERLVVSRLNLTRSLSRDLHRLVDELD